MLEHSLAAVDAVGAARQVRRCIVTVTNFFQRRQGVLQECFGVAPLCRVACKAAFDGHRNPAAVDREKVTEYRGRAIRLRVWTTAKIGENRHEGAAATIGEVGAAVEAAFQTLGDALEEAIADMAAMGVIDVAQALDVKDDDRRVGVLFGPSAQHQGKVLAEDFALGEAGQRVKCREMGRSALIRQRSGEAPNSFNRALVSR